MLTEIKKVGTIDLTPTWQEILPTWKIVVDDATKTLKPDQMERFWGEMQRMADSADRYGWLIEDLRRDYDEQEIFELIENGKRLMRERRSQIKPVEAADGNS